MPVRSRLIAAALGLAVVLPALGFGQGERVRVLSSVLPLCEFAASVAGERGDVDLLLPPGAAVHDWQPRPGDIRRLASCDLFLYIGADLEPWLPGLLRAAPQGRIRTLEVSRGLALLEAVAPRGEIGGEHDHGFLDPHIWLDFGLDIQIVERIAEELIRIDHGGREVYQHNAARLAARLRDLDERYRQGLADCTSHDIVLAGHAAFGYLARRFALNQIALFGPTPDSQASPGEFIEIVELCRSRRIGTVFFENSVSPDAAKALAREIGGRVMVLHTGHNLTREQRRGGVGFFDLMEENLKNLREGLGCR